jgi:hypothetical protein
VQASYEFRAAQAAQLDTIWNFQNCLANAHNRPRCVIVSLFPATKQNSYFALTSKFKQERVSQTCESGALLSRIPTGRPAQGMLSFGANALQSAASNLGFERFAPPVIMLLFLAPSSSCRGVKAILSPLAAAVPASCTRRRKIVNACSEPSSLRPEDPSSLPMPESAPEVTQSVRPRLNAEAIVNAMRLTAASESTMANPFGLLDSWSVGTRSPVLPSRSLSLAPDYAYRDFPLSLFFLTDVSIYLHTILLRPSIQCGLMTTVNRP